MYRTPTTLSLLFIGLILLLSGCRSDSNPADILGKSNVIAPEVVTAKIRANPDFFNPYQSSRAWTNTILEYAFQKLMYRNQSTLDFEPVLAKSAPAVRNISEGQYAGGYALDFEILDEAKWDNGTPITGYDYLTTMKIVHNPAGSRLLPLYKDILKFMGDITVDADNPKKFTIYTKEPNYKMVENAAWYVMPAYHYDRDKVMDNYKFADFCDPKKAEAMKSDKALVKLDSLFLSPEMTATTENIVGSGPYQISEWKQNEYVVITKKENWWGEKVLDSRPSFVAYPKAIRFDVIPDETAVITKVKNNDIDIVNTISGAAFEDLKKNTLVAEHYEFRSPETLSINYMGINNKNPKLSDARVRRALSCLLDRKTVIETVYSGHADPLYGPIVPKYDYALNDDKYSYNPAKARELLSEAGWEDTNGNGIRDKVIDGKLTELELTFLTSPANRIVQQMLLIFKEEMQKAGIEMKQVEMQARQRAVARRKGEFEIMTAASVLDGSDYELYQYFHTDSPSNFFGAGNAKIDALIEEVTKTVDPDELKKRFKEFQEALNEEQFLVFLTTPKERMLINKRLKDLEITIVRPNYLANTAHL